MSQDEPQVLSLEQVRARVQARQKAGLVDVSRLPTFEHAGLGGRVRYSPLASGDAHQFNNPEQYYPLDHPDPNWRGRRASTDAMEGRTRDKLVLSRCVWTEDAKRLPEEIVEMLLDDPLSGPSNMRLVVAVLTATNGEEPARVPPAEDMGLIRTFSQWEAAYHDLLLQTGWVAYWVEYVTASDTSTPEAKEAARKLGKLEAAAPEWAERLQSRALMDALLKADEPKPEE